MQYDEAKELHDLDFKRLFGVHLSTFEAMVQVMQAREQSKQKAGRTSKLSVPDQVLVTLQYWREYRTYFHFAQDWGVAESTLYRTVQRVETSLIRSGKFRLPGKKHLLTNPDPPKTITVDVSESPIECPQRYQKRFYSGKKQRHTLKIQWVIEISPLSKLSVPLTAKAGGTTSSCCATVTLGFIPRVKDWGIKATRAGRSFIPTCVCPRRSRKAAS